MHISLQSATPSSMKPDAASTAQGQAAPSAFKDAIATAQATPAAANPQADARSGSRDTASRDGDQKKNDHTGPTAAQPQADTNATAVPVLLALPMVPVVPQAQPDLSSGEANPAAGTGSTQAAVSFVSHIPAAGTMVAEADMAHPENGVPTFSDLAVGKAQQTSPAATQAKPEPGVKDVPVIAWITGRSRRGLGSTGLRSTGQTYCRSAGCCCS